MAHILTMIMTSAAVLKGKRSLGGDRVGYGMVGLRTARNASGNVMLNRWNFTPLWARIYFRTIVQMQTIAPKSIIMMICPYSTTTYHDRKSKSTILIVFRPEIITHDAGLGEFPLTLD